MANYKKIGTKNNRLYRVYDEDKIIFEGSKREVTEKFGGDCYKSYQMNKKLADKYTIAAVINGVEHFPSEENKQAYLDTLKKNNLKYYEKRSKPLRDAKEAQKERKKYIPKKDKPLTFKEEYESVKWHLDRYGNTNIVDWKDRIVKKLKKDGYHFNVVHYIGLDPVAENYKKTKKRVALSLGENSFDRDSIDNEDWIITLI